VSATRFYLCCINDRADTAGGWTTRIPPMSIPRALRSQSALSSSSTPRRPSASSSHTLPQLAVTPPRSSVSSTPFRLVTSTVSQHQSTGFLAMMLSSTPALRTRRLKLCSLNSALSSHTSDSPLCQRSRLLPPSNWAMDEGEKGEMRVAYDNEKNVASLAACILGGCMERLGL